MFHNVFSRLGYGRDWFRYGVVPFYLTLTATIFVNDAGVEITTINGASMMPSLSPSFKTDGKRDVVAWRKWQPTQGLQRGDVVFFSAPHNPEGIAVKRVVALGGDMVVLDPRRRPRDVESGRESVAGRHWDMWRGHVRIPDGHVWVEGDNWRETHDSNAYGPISRGLIKGRAMVLVWPWMQFGKKPWENFTNRTRVIPGVEEEEEQVDENNVYWKPIEKGG